MFYEESFKHLEEQCTCCICLERYNDPASLPCGHSCCRSCFEEILKLGEGPRPQTSITCPICRKICFLRGQVSLCSLPVNKDLQEKLNILSAIVPENKNKPTEKCQLCAQFPKNDADFRCLSCDKYLCSPCLNEKNFFDPEHWDHHVARLETKDDGTNALRCKDHKFCFRYFCKTCDRLVCSECCLKGHKSHDRMLAKNAKQRVKNEVQIIYESTKQKSTKTESALLKCKESMGKFENERLKLKNDLRKEKRKVLSQILYVLNKIEDDYMKKFDDQVDYFKKILQEKFDEAQLKHTRVSSWKEALDETLKIQDDTNFLAKAEHVKKNVNEINSLEIGDDDDNRIHNLFHDTEVLDAKIPDSMFDKLFSCLGDLQIKGSRNARRWQTYASPIDDNIIQDAKKQDGSNLAMQMKQTEPVTALPSLMSDPKNPVPVSGAASSASCSTTLGSFSEAVQTRPKSPAVVHVTSAFVAESLPTAQGASAASAVSAGTNPGVHVGGSSGNMQNANRMNSSPSRHGISASVPDVRMASNNTGAGNQGGGSQGRGRGRGRGRGGRGRGGSASRNSPQAMSVLSWSDSDDDSESMQSSSSSPDVVYCHRCLRHYHTYRDCHAVRDSNGKWIRGVIQNKCFRCGRRNHSTEDCYARYDVDGDRL